METCERIGAFEESACVVTPKIKDQPMHLSTTHLSPILAIIAGVAILLVPRLLNYIVAIYLIIIGILGLNIVHIG